MRTGVIINARTQSSRLPGKVLLPAPGGNTMLDVMLDRVKRSQVDEIIVATTTHRKDDDIVDLVKSPQHEGVAFFRWNTEVVQPENQIVNDVLSLVYQAASQFKLDYIIRLTADCPLVDWEAIDKAASILGRPGVSYVETSPQWPEGLDVQGFPAWLLARTWQEATLGSDREHVVLYMKRSAIAGVQFLPPAEGDYGHIRVTLDYPEDYHVVSEVLQELGPFCTTAQLIDLWEKNPDLFRANSHITRNGAWQAQAMAEQTG